MEFEMSTPLNEFARAYVECALWSSTGDDGEPLDKNHGPEDIAPATLETMVAACAAFESDPESDSDSCPGGRSLVPQRVH